LERRLGQGGEGERAVAMPKAPSEQLPADKVEAVARKVFRDLRATVQGVVVLARHARAGPQKLTPGLGQEEAGETMDERTRADREREFAAARCGQPPGRALPQAVPEKAERQREDQPAAEAGEGAHAGVPEGPIRA